jgi:YD repeat-containing protein
LAERVSQEAVTIEPSNPARTSTRTFARSLLLPEVILPVCLLVSLLCVMIFRKPWVRPAPRPVVVTYKSAAELAKIKPAIDSYPCFVVERTKSGSSLHAEIRQCVPSLPNQAEIEQYKIFLWSGYFTMLQTDMFISDSIPLVLTRGYWQWYSGSEAFGAGAGLAYDIHPFGDRFPYTYMKLELPDGDQIPYHRISQGTSFLDDVQEHTGTPPTVFDKSRIWWNRDHWDMSFPDGTMYRFPEAYYAKRSAQAALVGMRDPAGNEVKFVRDKSGNLTRVTSPGGHWIKFDYDTHNRIPSAEDDSGRGVAYSYDEQGRLAEVSRGQSTVWRYSYDSSGMTAIQDATRRTILTIHYKGGRIESLRLADGRTYQFDYLFNQRGDVVETRVRDPKGKFTTFRF